MIAALRLDNRAAGSRQLTVGVTNAVLSPRMDIPAHGPITPLPLRSFIAAMAARDAIEAVKGAARINSIFALLPLIPWFDQRPL